MRLLLLTTVAIIMVFSSVWADPGDTLMSIPTPGECPQGLTFDGEYLWNIDRKSDMIYRVDPQSGHVDDSLVTPGFVPRGLTWDGKRLWCIDAEEELIYAVNPQTRIIEKSIYCPVGRPMGLAWDGRYLWLAADRNEEIHQISPEDGTTIKTIPAPTRNSTGITFDGTCLWVADRYKDMIFMVTPEEGEVIISLDAPAPHAWGLAWDSQNLWNADYQSDRIYKIDVSGDKKYVRSDPKTQEVEFIMQARNYGPGPLKTLDMYIAVPHDLPNQDMLSEATFEPKPTDMPEDKWNLKCAHFRFSDIPAGQFEEVKMTASAKLYKTRYFVYPDKVGGLDEIPQDIVDMYTVDDAKFDYNNPIIRKAVEQAVGDETNPYWIARKIFKYLIDNMYYELAGGWNVAPAVLERGNGSCSEYSFVFIAMCRAAGVPARFAGSIVVRGDDASYDDVFHRWVEVYLPGYKWIPVDPSGGDQKWPADQARYFGYLDNRFLITTLGGGGSEFLEWGYNTNAFYTGQGRCKVVIEYFGEWTPIEETD